MDIDRVDDFASFVFYIRLSRETCRGVEILRRAHLEPVMWSETVGLSLLGQDRSETKKSNLGLGLVRCGLGLAGLVLFCEKRSCHTRRHNDLDGHSNFSSTIYSFSILCLEHHY